MRISEIKLKSLLQILRKKAKESDGIRITIYAYKQGEDKGLNIVDKADRKTLSNINKLLTIENYVRAKIEVFDTNVSEKPRLQISVCLRLSKLHRQLHRLMGWVHYLLL
jgi:hypothetical protein